MSAFNSALSGLAASSNLLEVISNNIANINTVGFKASTVQFGDFLTSTTGGPGAGVQVESIDQVFTEGGQITTGRALDMSISGTGFFRIVDADGNASYTRAGSFNTDSDSQLVDSEGNLLTGFSADDAGAISAELGVLSISQSDQEPNPTSTFTLTENFDVDSSVPATEFSRGFSSTNAPSTNSYNFVTTHTFYDSLGASHTLSIYHVKTTTDNRWELYLGVDGEDITPAATAQPSLGSTWSNHSPYTVVFDSSGNFIVNNSSSPPVFSARANTTAAQLDPVSDATTLVGPDGTNLTINSTAIGAASGTISAAKIASSIDQTSTVGALGSPTVGYVDASATTTVDLGLFTAPPTGTTTQITINALGMGTERTMDITIDSTATAADFITAINTATTTGGVTVNSGTMDGATTSTGVRATNTSGVINLISDGTTDGTTALNALTAVVGSAGTPATGNVSGSNIRLSVSSNTAPSSVFANFSTNTVGNDLTTRGAVTLTSTSDAGTILIGGSGATNMGFDTSQSFEPVVSQTSSDDVSFTYTPDTGAAAQTITLDFSNSTQLESESAILQRSSDGYPAGSFQNIVIDSDGIGYATYTNGQSKALWQLAVVDFANERGLLSTTGVSWLETSESGAPLIGYANAGGMGTVVSSNLEGSNVDLTEELVGMINAQKAFSANSKAISTQDQLTQEILNLR